MSTSHTRPPSPRGALARLVAVSAAAVLAAPVFILAGQGGASAETATFTDGHYDPQTEHWADVETYGVDADTNRLDLSIGGPDLVADYHDQGHTLVFRLDTDGDNDTDFSLLLTVTSTVETQRDAEHLFEQARPAAAASPAVGTTGLGR